jgi:hypothetical protein
MPGAKAEYMNMKRKNLFNALWLALVLMNIGVAYAKPAQRAKSR